jgi:type I restriction enzyme S subunit
MNNMMAKIPLVIPPKPEQTAIANYLDDKTAKIDTLIEKKKNLIELLKEERTAVINKAVTRGVNPNVKLKPSGIEWLGDIPEHWEVKKLKYIFQLSRGFDLSSNNFETGVIPVCGSNGIIGYHNKSTVKGPGITVGRSGSVGEVNFIETDFWAHNTCLYVYKNFDNNLKYIFYFLRVFDLKSLSSGSAVGTLNRNYIHAENIAFPTKFEQNQIVQHIEAETKRIDCAISKIEKEIELLIEYRIALISEVVTGKIKV